MDCYKQESKSFKELMKDSKKLKKEADKVLIEIWKSDGFDGETITIVNNRTGIMKDYSLKSNSKLPKNEGDPKFGEFMDTDDFLRPNGYKRMRQIEDILE